MPLPKRRDSWRRGRSLPWHPPRQRSNEDIVFFGGKVTYRCFPALKQCKGSKEGLLQLRASAPAAGCIPERFARARGHIGITSAPMQGACREGPQMRFALACGKIRNESDRAAIRAHFDARGWIHE